MLQRHLFYLCPLNAREREETPDYANVRDETQSNAVEREKQSELLFASRAREMLAYTPGRTVSQELITHEHG